MIQNYIGTRDFPPKEWKLMKYVFNNWRSVSESFGFEEYEAPIICPVKLFTDKSGDEIKNQLFWFKDKGDRDVCLRAELTPELAQMMINYSKALKKPIKWFSIPRLFRYEKPQRGRLREFFQYNVDIIGDDSVFATSEVINLGINLLKSFGLKKNDFIVRINSRKIVDSLMKRVGVTSRDSFYLILDKKDKMKEEDFFKELKPIVKEVSLLKELFTLDSKSLIVELDKLGVDVSRIKDLFNFLPNGFVKFDLSIVRGLAYYTDIVFECFDKKGELRAVFGGGEYNDLIKSFGGESTPAVGLGMGDAVLVELLKNRKLIPDFKNNNVFIATIGNVKGDSLKLRDQLISKGFNVDLNISDKNLSKQFAYAESKGINKVYILGEKELSKGVIKEKDLVTGKEKSIKSSL